MNPHKVGLSAKTLQKPETLHSRLNCLLKLMKQVIPDSGQTLYRVFSVEAEEHFFNFRQIDDIIDFKDDMEKQICVLKLFVKGFVL